MREEISLLLRGQAFTVALVSTIYGFRIHCYDTAEGGSVFDLLDAVSSILIASAPLLPNADLLARHKHPCVEGTLTL